MNYQQYLKSPEWEFRRLATFERDEHRCVLCYSLGNLECHHRTYIRIGNERPGDLTTLCKPCHANYSSAAKVSKPASSAWGPITIGRPDGMDPVDATPPEPEKEQPQIDPDWAEFVALVETYSRRLAALLYRLVPSKVSVSGGVVRFFAEPGTFEHDQLSNNETLREMEEYMEGVTGHPFCISMITTTPPTAEQEGRADAEPEQKTNH